jgi:hypothetical protein
VASERILDICFNPLDVDGTNVYLGWPIHVAGIMRSLGSLYF